MIVHILNHKPVETTKPSQQIVNRVCPDQLILLFLQHRQIVLDHVRTRPLKFLMLAQEQEYMHGLECQIVVLHVIVMGRLRLPHLQGRQQLRDVIQAIPSKAAVLHSRKTCLRTLISQIIGLSQKLMHFRSTVVLNPATRDFAFKMQVETTKTFRNVWKIATKTIKGVMDILYGIVV